MKLTNFSFSKFRSIKEELSIPFQNISIYIGQNGGGKTATIDALKLFIRLDENFKERDFNNTCANEERQNIIFKGKFKLNDMEQTFFKQLNSDVNDEIELHKKFNLDEGFSQYFIYTKGTGTDLDNLNLGRSREPYEILCEEYQIKRIKKLSIIEMKEKLKELCDQLPKDEIVEINIEKTKLKDYLPEFIHFSSEEALDPKDQMIQILKETLKEKLPELKIGKEIKKITKVIIDVCRDKIKEAQDCIKKYCTDIKTIDVLPEYNALGGLKLSNFNIIKDNGKPVNFDSEATGKRKQIMLGLYEWSNLQITEEVEKDFILAFDEPDLHFDYIQINNLLKILRDFSKKDKIHIIVATHSIKLIDNFPPNQIVNFKLTEHKTTQIEYLTSDDYDEIRDFLKEILLTIGIRSTLLFFEKSFVIVEGDSEYKAFPALFELVYDKNIIEAGISFINAEDNEQALKLANFLRRNKREVLIIIDRDLLKKKHFSEKDLRKLGFIKDKDYYLVGKESESESEFEAEFSSELWVRLFNNEYPKNSGDEWEIDEIEELRTSGKFSENLTELLWEECLENVSKPNLCLKMAKSIIDKNELSGNIVSILDKLNSISD